MATVAVLGGGISGLSAAYYLLKFGQTQVKKVLIYELSAHLGGWIQSTRFPDGAIYEHGPRSIRPMGDVGQNTLSMVEDLQLTSSIIPILRGHPVTKNRLLLVDDQLYKLPGLSALFLSTPPFTRPLAFYALKDLFKKRTLLTDESMYSFAERRLGKEIATLIVDPLCRGVYAGDAKEISVKALMKTMFEAEQKYGSILRGLTRVSKANITKRQVERSELGKRAKTERWAIWNFTNGLQTLPDTLSKRLAEDGVEIHSGTPCLGIKFTDGGARLDIKGSQEIECNHVMAALPASRLASLLEKNDELVKRLCSIPTVTTAVVTLEFQGFPNELLKQQAFGFLVPSSQPYPILGVIFDSCCFPQHDAAKDRTRLTVMMGGHCFEKHFGNPESVKHEDLLKAAINVVQTQLKIPGSPIRYQVLMQKNCIPQYTVGHFERVNEMRNHIDARALPLSLMGASYDGVGINDCIYSAKKRVCEYLNLGKNENL